MRSTRLGLFTALSPLLLAVAGCSSTPTDSEPVVITRATPDPTTLHTTVDTPPPAPSTPAATGTTVPEAPSPVAAIADPVPVAAVTSTSEDLLFLSYITEFTLMERPESDQIRLGLAICNSLHRGQNKDDLTATYVGGGRYSPAEVANAMTAATVAYCPDFG